MSTHTASPTGASAEAKEAAMLHPTALFTGVSPIEHQLAAIAQLEDALATGKRVVNMTGSWQTYRGRREIEQALAARLRWVEEVTA